MSKLAGGNLGTDLEALVGMGDTSVPGLEMSDLNDGDILSATRENVNPNGLFQFVYTAIDPPIVSDWVDQEHKKKLTRQWVDGVKGQIIARAQAGIQEAKEKALEERAKKIRQEQMDEDTKQEETLVQPAASIRAPRQAAEPVRRASVSSDPGSYVEEQLEMTRERLRAAEEAQRDITREVLTARRDYDKWKALAAALGGVDGDDDDGEHGTEGPAPVRPGGGLLFAGQTSKRNRVS